ncbi:MAG: hypothetical protein MJY97_05535 [Bacteroidales bacterium]|nr:hypothetical protein [Bacteroidales bacterium]
MKPSHYMTLAYAAFALFVFVKAFNSNPAEKHLTPVIESADTPATATFRAIKAIDENTVWAAGSANTVARTLDGGESWDVFTVGDSLKTEFRSLMAWDASTALVFTIDSPAIGYRTDDGGKSWYQVYYNPAQGMFIDSVSFSDDLNGVAVGDPLDGHIFVITTDDGGHSWTEIQGPENAGGMFAASNTCVTMTPSSRILIAASSSEVHIGDGKQWSTIPTPITKGADNGCDGCYGVWMSDEERGFLYGGNYEYVSNKTGVLARTIDSGRSWQLCEEGIHGFVSAVAPVNADRTVRKKQSGAYYVASGSDGISFSKDGGYSWEDITASLPEGVKGYHALSSADDIVWGAGSHGHIGRIQIR